jgi:hypothetical protein
MEKRMFRAPLLLHSILLFSQSAVAKDTDN